MGRVGSAYCVILAVANLLCLFIPFQMALAEGLPPRNWMPLQSNSAGWQKGMTQPLAEGKIIEIEYANGVKFELNDFTNTAKGGNGALYLNLSDNVVFTPAQCKRSDGSACTGATLDIGLRVHANNSLRGDERGQLQVFIDGARQLTLDGESCGATVNQSHLPSFEDRRITIFYQSNLGRLKPTLTMKQAYGGCAQGWIDIPNEGGAIWPVTMGAFESVGRPGSPNFLHFELSITVQPREAWALSSQIVTEKLFGLGIRHQIFRRPAESFGYFPSIYNKSPADLDTWSWATMDLHAPPRIDLSMTAYNVGQPQITDDGGQAEADDIAQLTYKNDIVCLVEEMVNEERSKVVSEINRLRKAEGLTPVTPVYPPNGDAPNNMLLAAGPIIDSDYVRFGDLPEVSAYCGENECIGDGAGYKGIVWARVGTKKSGSTSPVCNRDGTCLPGKSETWFSDHFIDVFCTHTQADYGSDGRFAQNQWCYDTLPPPANGVSCSKGKFGPSENPWKANLRDEQWRALKAWADKKRAGGHGSPNGLDRPAFVLGDLNQIGPKGVSTQSANSNIDNWIAAHPRGPEYQSMREILGTMPVSAFDQATGWTWGLYDLVARNENGTWIGNGTESNVTDTSANDCMVGSHGTYIPLVQLPNEARVDYILVLPAEGSFPFYSLVGPNSHSVEPVIQISANEGTWTDGVGCASDHAQVSATVGLVQTKTLANYNPNKTHRLTYRISHLWDIHNSDKVEVFFVYDDATDWYSPCPGGFKMERTSSSGSVLESINKCYNDGSTPDGRSAPVNWYDWVYPTGDDKVRACVQIKDSDDGPDDTYDGTSFTSAGQSQFVEPCFEFNHAYPGTFAVTGKLNPAFTDTRLLGTADFSASDPDASCKSGCLGVVTSGNGDGTDVTDDVQVTQSLMLEETD